MPVRTPDGLERLSEQSFTQAAYEVVAAAFAVHAEFGGMFDERIYKTELARRLKNAQNEVLVEVTFESFRKAYYLDLLYADGAVFELKATDGSAQAHRAQLLNYLFLLELPHGKLVNFRGDSVRHEFVNATLTRAERTAFRIDARDFEETDGALHLVDLLVPILRDWGTCLEVELYLQAVTHFLGGEQCVAQSVPILPGIHPIGEQLLRLLTPETAFKLTAFDSDRAGYEAGLRKFLSHTPLRQIQWMNVGTHVVTFKTIRNP
jgi:GxxExxY protein